MNTQTRSAPNAVDAAKGELLKVSSAPTEAGAVANIVTKLAKSTLVAIPNADPTAPPIHVLVAPGGEVSSVKKLVDEYRTAPERRKGTAVLHDLSSFVAHVMRFQDDDSAIFADRNPAGPSMTAIFDYHRATCEGAPRFGEHRARYAFPLSDEWIAWSGANAKPMSQALFAEFLEGRIADVTDAVNALPTTTKIMESLLCTFASPSKLMDLARGLTVRVESTIANQQNLQNGASVMRFDTAHTGERGEPLEVPGAFLVSIPVFRGDAAYQIGARLRYRIKPGEGKVTWWFELYRATETFDHAFSEACLRATKETSLPLFMGTPE